MFRRAERVAGWFMVAWAHPAEVCSGQANGSTEKYPRLKAKAIVEGAEQSPTLP